MMFAVTMTARKGEKQGDSDKRLGRQQRMWEEYEKQQFDGNGRRWLLHKRGEGVASRRGKVSF